MKKNNVPEGYDPQHWPIKVLTAVESGRRLMVAKHGKPLDSLALAQPDERWHHPSGRFHLEKLPAFAKRRQRSDRPMPHEKRRGRAA